MRADSGRRPKFLYSVANAVLLFYLVLLLGFFAGLRHKLLFGSRAAGVTLDDVVVVVPTDETRRDLVIAGRLWRKGLRTVVITNFSEAHVPEDAALHNETWTFYPDYGLDRGNYYPGDYRAALAPLLAHVAFNGTYKWLLYGDDDTLFFPLNVQRLVNQYDERLPYFLTDNMWFIFGGLALHPNVAAPRCLPCHVSSDDAGGWQRRETLSKAWGFEPPRGCPCTPQLLCEKDSRGFFDEGCTVPVPLPSVPYSLHGGAGGIFSRAVWEGINASEFQQCVHTASAAGGDAYISHCLWAAGVAPTDPGIGLTAEGPRAFDPGNYYGAEGWANGALGLLFNLSAAVSRTDCDDDCQAGLEAVVSTHIHVRAKGLQSAVQQMEMLPPLHRAWHHLQACAGSPSACALPEDLASGDLPLRVMLRPKNLTAAVLEAARQGA